MKYSNILTFLFICVFVFSINSYAGTRPSESSEFKLDQEQITLSSVKISEVRELIDSIGPENTCMDEYLKRRNNLILEIVAIANPITILAGVSSGFMITGELIVAGGSTTVFTTYIGALIGGSSMTLIGTVPATSIAVVQLLEVDKILMALAEQHSNQPGKKSDKLYAKYVRDFRNQTEKEDFFSKLIALDESGKLCDGSMVDKSKISSRKQLKFKLALAKQIFSNI